MSEVATVSMIVAYLQDGTGDPGLQFVITDETQITEFRRSHAIDQWVVVPVDIVAEDATYGAAALVVTILPGPDGGPPVWVFVGVDMLGEPCAAHTVQ